MSDADDADDADGPDDPFAGLELDDEFIRGATRKEESAAERVARLQRIEQEHRRLQAESAAQRSAAIRSAAKEVRQARRQHRSRWWRTVVVMVALLGLLVWMRYRPGSASVIAAADKPSVRAVVSTEHPPPGVDERPAPLGAPAQVPAGSGPFKFIEQQDATANPVAYDPCRPIHLVVNGRTAPPEGDTLLRQAVEEVSTVTGLSMVIDGPSDEVPSEARPPYQPDRYPGRWAPVLIAWSDPDETPRLADDVVGLGGSTSVTLPSGSVFVTGGVELDGPDMAEIIRDFGPDEARAVILHELGHLVGLDHVDDKSQLMNPDGVEGVTDFAVGDRLGLEQLGRGPCFPEV